MDREIVLAESLLGSVTPYKISHKMAEKIECLINSVASGIFSEDFMLFGLKTIKLERLGLSSNIYLVIFDHEKKIQYSEPLFNLNYFMGWFIEYDYFETFINWIADGMSSPIIMMEVRYGDGIR